MKYLAIVSPPTIYHNDANLSAMTPPISMPSQVDKLYPRKEQPPEIFFGIAASLSNWKRNRKWHADVARLMPSLMRRLNPQRMVMPSLNLWGMYNSQGSGKPPSNRGWEGGTGTIAADINSINIEYDYWIWSIVLNESNEQEWKQRKNINKNIMYW